MSFDWFGLSDWRILLWSSGIFCLLNMEIKGVKGCVDSRGGVLVDRRFFRLAAGGWLAVGACMKVNLHES